ncbi:MAG: hypothetical protein GXX78_06180 [Bacteroidales bacterium]|nr:hypothetical protein [Bacteroidales bacterium]
MMKSIHNQLVVVVFLLAVVLSSCSSTKKIASYNAQNISVDKQIDTVQDISYLSIIQPYTDKLASELTGIVAIADTSLIAYRPESPLSNFISDLLLAWGKTFTKTNQPTISIDFSLVNIGGLRTSLPQGEIQVRNIFELLPFENELVFVQLKGNQVNILLDHLASRDGEGVSGTTFGIKKGKAVEVTVGGNPVDNNKLYWVLTNDYVANGGDGMKVLTEAVQRVDTGEKIRDVVISELKEMNQKGIRINAKNDGRVYYVEQANIH